MIKESKMQWNWGTRVVEDHRESGCWEFRLSKCCASPSDKFSNMTCRACGETTGFVCEICEDVVQIKLGVWI
jgi:hypothetical protein